MTDRLARWSLYATAALALFVVPGFYFPFVTVRAFAFRLLTALAAACFLLRLRNRSLEGRDLRDPLLVAITALCTTATVAALAGVAPWRSFFGDFERMWGVLTLLHFLLYYVLLRSFFDARDWRVFFTVLFMAGGTACLTAVAQRLFGTARPGGSLGNPGYLAIYSTMIVAVGLMMLKRESGIDRKAAWFAIVAGVAGFWVAATRSALIGLIAAGATAVLVTPALRTRKLLPARVAVLVAALALVVVAQTPLSRYLPLVLQRTFATSFSGSDTVRFISWKSALAAARDRPILGWGPENATPAFNAHFDPAYYLVLPKGDRLDRFHNAYLEALVTSGVLGLLAFLAFWIAAGWTAYRGYRRGRLTAADYALVLAILVANVVYFLFWFEDLTSFAALLALLAYLRFRVSGTRLFEASATDRGKPAIAFAGTAVVAAYAVMHCVLPARAAYFLEKADGASGVSVDQRIGYFEAALARPVSQRMHTLMRYVVFMRRVGGKAEALRRDPYRAAEFQGAIDRLKHEIDFDRRRDPRNDVWELLQAEVATVELAFRRDPRSYYGAIEHYERAIGLSPMRVRHRLNLARTYMLARDTTHALQQLRAAARLYPALAETYAEFARVYFAAGNAGLATVYVEQAVSRGYRLNAEMLAAVNRYMVEQGEWARSAELLRTYLQDVYSPDWLRSRNSGVLSRDRWIAIQYAVSAAMSGDTTVVAEMNRFAQRADPVLLGLVARLQEDLRNGRLAEWVALQAPPG